jgi:F-type H+-transporting ATPase subunit a
MLTYAKILKNRIIKPLVLSVFLSLSFTGLSAQEHTSPANPADTHHEVAAEAQQHATGRFNAGEMIMEHILDAHEWHVLTYNGHHVSIPLPVILYAPGKGLDMFLSSRFGHGHASWNGYRLEHGKIVAEDGSAFYDLSITKNTAAMMISVLLLLFIFISIANAYKRRAGQAPKGIQSLMEPIILFIRDEVAKPSIGPKYERYVPYLLTVFFFIWINNMMGLIPIFPFGANVTGNIAVTMTLALFTFVITLVIANKGYWAHIVNTPGVPWWLKFPVPLMPVVEFLGVFIKPFVLMLRLFANITAGHIIPLGFFALIFIFGEMSQGVGMGVSVISVAFSLFMSCLELLVAFLQAYVFTLLSAMYFGMAIEEHHHDHEHAHDHSAGHHDQDGHEEKPAVI